MVPAVAFTAATSTLAAAGGALCAAASGVPPPPQAAEASIDRIAALAASERLGVMSAKLPK